MLETIRHWMKGRSTQGDLSGTWHAKVDQQDRYHAQDKEMHLICVHLGMCTVRFCETDCDIGPMLRHEGGIKTTWPSFTCETGRTLGPAT
jgi:hypothetical protein